MAKDDRKLERTRSPGIFKRGERYVVIVRDQHGKQLKRFAPTLAAAKGVQAELRSEVARGEFRQLSKSLFTDYAEQWAESYGGSTSRGVKPQTLKDYKAAVTRPEFLEVFRGLKLAEVEPEHLEQYAKKLAAANLSARTVRNVILPVRLMLARAKQRRHIRDDPAAGLRLVQAMGKKKGKRSREDVRALEEAELSALFVALGKHPETHRLLAEFLLQTGARIGEALALTWGDVAFAFQTVSITKRIYKGTTDAPKSEKSSRTIPLSPVMTASLQQHRGSAPDSAPVFTNDRGARLDYYDARRHFKEAATTAGVEWAGFHTLRHTCASILFRSVERGGLAANAVQVQLWLGHHRPSFTLDTYVHLLDEDLPDAAGFDTLLSHGATQGATRATKKARNRKSRSAA